ncbi:condensation domain-containing protein [Saccharothrix longispora]|uniref:condensation domain-containing protein n=1 Tax=Saccharothrix longispora TaxID=33920 RepID=UPI0028FD315D|nr:condensation domain-containing protein [Saccharothrix longispora]MDU0292211.1 condensation domain-containing protein [Saccharothrix longispora]
MTHRLTAAQRAIWSMQEDDPASPLWNLGGYLEIEGPLDLDRFARAVHRAVIEAESPAVRFEAGDDGPRQVVTRPRTWPMPLVDTTAEPDPRAAAETVMLARLDRPMPLFDGPLCQETLFRVAPGRHLWFRKVHHLVLDAYGSVLIGRRIADLYAAPNSAPPSNFPPVAEVLADESGYEASARAAVDREYWLRRFSEPYQAVNLAGRVPAPPYRRALRRSCYLPPNAQTSAKALGASLPAIMTALLAHYLSRRTGAPEVIIQLPVTGRLGPLARRATAVLANRVPVRVSVPPTAGPFDLVPQVVRELRACLRHQRYRVEDLLRDASGAVPFLGPKVNVWVRGYDMALAGSPVLERNLNNGPVTDLSVIIYPEPDQRGLRVHMDANPDLYRPEDLETHLRHLVRPLADRS